MHQFLILRKRLLVAALGPIVIVSACNVRRHGQLNTESLVFALLGDRPFQDSIVSISLPQAKAESLLVPAKDLSYIWVSGYSLNQPLFVSVHQLSGTGTVVDRLQSYDPATGKFEGFNLPEGIIGGSQISSDGSTLVFSYTPMGRGVPARLWVFDLRSNAARSLFEDPDQANRYVFPKWSPSATHVGFLQLQRTPRGLLTRPMLIGLSESTPEALLDTSDGVSALCFSPDGAQMGLLTKLGIEIFSFATRQRRLIVPWSQFEGRKYLGGGLSWSPLDGLIAIALSNPQKSSAEIWEFQLNGQGGRCLYNGRGRIMGLSFIGQ